MFVGGVRAAFVTSALVAPAMIAQHSGLIANISCWAGQKYMNSVMCGAAKTASDRLAANMAHELRTHHVAAVSLYPGLVRTERVLRNARYSDMSNTESPQFIGRVISALAADPDVMEKSGRVWVAAALALEDGVTDVDSRQPRPLTLEDSQRSWATSLMPRNTLCHQARKKIIQRSLRVVAQAAVHRRDLDRGASWGGEPMEAFQLAHLAQCAGLWPPLNHGADLVEVQLHQGPIDLRR